MKRKRKDFVLNGLTYISSGLSFFVLLSIFLFVLVKGFGHIDFALLTDDYWSSNYVVKLQEPKVNKGFAPPSNLSEDAYFSAQWGIAVVDYQKEDQTMILLEYIDPNSPFKKVYSYSGGEPVELKVGVQIERVNAEIEGEQTYLGNVNHQSSEEFIESLNSSDSIQSVFVQTTGGGIRGSIITTFLLIILTMLFALPIGIAAAIYINEYEKNQKIRHILHSMIELLSGIPSIIFGLVGVSVLYPITAFFGVTTTSILLGSLTLTMMLLPIVMKSTEEALYNVSKDLKYASFVLGATASQTIFKVTLPGALPGILTGAILSIGRVIGESAALIYTMGTFVNDTPTITTQGTSLAVHIWSIMSGENPNITLATTIALVIMIFVLLLNILMKGITHRLSRGAKK